MALPRGCRQARDEWASCRNRAGTDGRRKFSSLEAIVSHYIERHRPRTRAEVTFYANLPSLAEAIRRAAGAERPDRKRHDHQTRLTKAALARARRVLSTLNLRRCRTFEELHELLTATLGPVEGIGKLMVYDTAIRIGAKLGLSPKVVFLHAGTRQGAAALGLGHSRAYLKMSELPTAFRRLAPREAEDCLCIYKGYLEALAV